MPVRRVLGAAAVLVTLAACSNRQAAVNKHPHNGVATATVRGGVQQLTVTTGVDLRFHPATLVVHQGRVRITLVNRTGSGVGPPHDLQVNGLPGVAVPLTSAGHSSSVTFDAPAPGTYSFVCTIHANQGQTGTLIVR